MISTYFKVGNNFRNIYDTLGVFWTAIFKDQTFITGTIKAQVLSVDEISDNIEKVNISLDEQKCPNNLMDSTYKLSILGNNIKQVKYTVGDKPKLYTDVFVVGQTNKNISYAITLPRKINDCRIIANTVGFNDSVLLKDIDFTQQDPETVIFKKHPSEYGFKYTYTNVDGIPHKVYSFYIKGSYGSFGYESRFGGIPAPSDKNSINYDLLTNEVTYTKLIQTFQKAAGITCASVEGRITRIWYEGDFVVLYNGSLIKVPKKFTLTVKMGDYVTPSTLLVKEIRYFDDIETSGVQYCYISPDRLPITKFGIIIPNKDIPISYDGSVYYSTEDGISIISTENDDALALEESSTDINLGIKGLPEDVDAFYNKLENGLAEYSVTLPEIATSSNPMSIIFKDIHNIKIPTVTLSPSVLYAIKDLNAVIQSLSGMSNPSSYLLINGNLQIRDEATVSFEDTVSCFIVYAEDTTTALNIEDTNRSVGDFI